MGRKAKAAASASSAVSAKEEAPERSLAVHTCRFVDWRPEAVAAMGVSGDGSRLAIARADGDVEIWETQRFHLEQRIVGEEGMSLRTLAWGGRGGRCLFVAGLSGEIMEVDLVRQRIASRLNSNGGPVWAMAFDRGGGIRGGSWCQLAAACEDGTVRLYSLAGGDGAGSGRAIESDSDDSDDSDSSDGESSTRRRHGGGAYDGEESDESEAESGLSGRSPLELVRVFSRAGARTLSVAWHPHGKFIFAGSADGRIRCLEAATGRVVHHMTVEDFGTGKRTMVWSLVVLSDWTVVSGDSLGHIQFWDGRPGSGVLMQSFAVFTRGADVLALAVTDDEDAVFASGVDHRVVQLRRVQGQVPAESASAAGEAEAAGTTITAAQMRWMYVASQRAHTHDVNALVVLPGVLPAAAAVSSSAEAGALSTAGSGASSALALALAPQVVVSAGVDTQLCVYPTAADVFQATDRVRKIPPFPHEPLGQLAPAARLLLARHSRRLELWRLAPRAKKKKGAKRGKRGKISSGDRDSGSGSSSAAAPPPRAEHLATVDVDSAHNLVCSALAPKGDWLAFADGGDGVLKLLAVEGADVHDGALELAPCSVRVVLGVNGKSGRLARVQRLAFSADSRTLVCATDRYADLNELYVIRLTRDGPSAAPVRSASVVHRFRRAVPLPNLNKWWHGADLASGGGADLAADGMAPVGASWWGRDDEGEVRAAPCTGLAISGDGQWLAAGDLSNRVSVFSLDAHKLHCTLPRFAAQHTAFAFNTNGTSSPMLVVACASNAFYAYNVEQRRLGDWSELYTKGLPNDMLRLKAKIIGISFNPASPSSLLLHTHNACIAAELELRPPARCIFLDRSSRRARGQQALNAEAPVKKRARLSNGSGSGSGKKSEEKSEGATGKFTVIERFRPTLFAGYVDDDEMVVVQRPWLQIMQHFPDPLRVNRFGS